MVNFKVATLTASMVGLAYGAVPTQCIQSTNQEIITAVPEGQLATINESVSNASNVTSQFYGLRTCMDKVTDRLISVQFYLKDEGSDELKEMPQLGPTIASDLVTCKRRKL